MFTCIYIDIRKYIGDHDHARCACAVINTLSWCIHASHKQQYKSITRVPRNVTIYRPTCLFASVSWFRDSDLSFLERKELWWHLTDFFSSKKNLPSSRPKPDSKLKVPEAEGKKWLGSFHLESQVFLGIQGFFRGLSWSFVVALANPGERYSTARGGGCDVTRWQGDIFDTHKGLKRGHVLKDLKTCVV